MLFRPKTIFIFFIIVCSSVTSWVRSQGYGNEWIDTTKVHVKFYVAKDGIYRIGYFSVDQFFTDKGQYLNKIPFGQIRMYSMGKEIPIYVKDLNNNDFWDLNEYIEFVGHPIDGTMDRELYPNPAHQRHTLTSIVDDSGCYFLTWRTTGTSLRYKDYVSSGPLDPAPRKYFLSEFKFAPRLNYAMGERVLVVDKDIYLPGYTSGEGFCGDYFYGGNDYSSINYAVRLPSRHYFDSGPAPTLESGVVGISNCGYFTNHSLRWMIGPDMTASKVIHDTTFSSTNPVTIQRTLKSADIGSDFTYLNFNSTLLNACPNSIIAHSHTVFTYPKKYKLDDSITLSFYEDTSYAPRKIEWTGYGDGFFSLPVVYDETNYWRMEGSYSFTQKKVSYVLPPIPVKSKLFMTDETKILVLNMADCRNANMKTFDDRVNREAYLMISAGELLSSPKQELQKYASEVWGTRYNVFLENIEDLYNNFNYGIRHPLAIRHYCKYLLEKSDPDKRPKYLFLLGRGFDMSFNHGYAEAQKKPFQSRNYIPAIGTPVSDNLFTAGLVGTLYEPAIPTGRIPIDKSAELDPYREKVKAYINSVQNYEDWQKFVLHLSGGASPGQAAVIRNRMDRMKGLVENDPFAGTVHTYSKSAGSGVDLNFATSITNELNTGISLVTFLGHGSSSVTDVDIGNPATYQNLGKYPIFYFNGCQVGNPCLPVDVSKYMPLSDKLLKYGGRGGVAFLGQTSTSELYTVAQQMEKFYLKYFDTVRDKSLGNVLRDAIKIYQNPTSFINRIHCEELLLQGDPALPVYSPSYPDFAVSNADMFLDPPNAVALMDSFRLGIIIRNHGKGITDSFSIRMSRTLKDGVTRFYYMKKWSMKGRVDTVYFTLKTKDKLSAGRNVFAVEINQEKIPVEFRYENNSATSEFNLPTNGLNLISPNRFAIVGTDSVELIAEANDMFKQIDDYYFEIDTTPRFNSPLLISLEKAKTPITSTVFAKWKIKLPLLRDTQPYYWRARLSSAAAEGGAWVMYSFTYIKNHGPGWMQNVAWQYNNKVSSNQFNSLFADTITNTVQFSRILKKIYIDCSYGSASNLGVKEAGFGSQDLNYGVCKGTGIVCIPWDGRRLVRKPVDPSKIAPDCFWGAKWRTFGHFEDYQLYYAFDMGVPGDQDQFIKFIDALEDSMYVTIYSRINAHVDAWKPAVFSALNKIGSAIFDTAGYRQDDAMWVALGRKGWKPGIAQEAVTFGRQFSYVQLEANMYGDAMTGNMVSEAIGPVDQYNKFYFNNTIETGDTANHVRYYLYGLNKDGGREILANDMKVLPTDFSAVNTKKYNYIQLEARFADSQDNSAPNLVNWRVTHSPVPEGTLYPYNKIGFVLHDDTLYEGDTFLLKLPFKNISKTKFRDSILYTYSCYNKTNRQILYSGRGRFSALMPDSSYIFNFKMPTTGLGGAFAFQFNVNQANDQPEVTLVNNSVLINFIITKDVMSPLLDVTFDGRHILNGDIVSANPDIRIESKDENKFLLQKDTSTFDLFVRVPGSTIFTAVKWGAEAMFYPAQNKENKARIEYRPLDLPQGTYTLKVQSRDVNKNLAGRSEYQVDFNVVREQSVTHFYPYPNPFTSSMRFVFTLTGTEVPDDIKVKIMTAEGRVVKEVSREELGDIHIGNNITSWTWDGTDQYGDKLGNGTYFYKVTVKNKGEEVKLRQSAGDDSFKEQVGVIYLMR